LRSIFLYFYWHHLQLKFTDLRHMFSWLLTNVYTHVMLLTSCGDRISFLHQSNFSPTPSPSAPLLPTEVTTVLSSVTKD
jgi:hypothetical protein